MAKECRAPFRRLKCIRCLTVPWWLPVSELPRQTQRSSQVARSRLSYRSHRLRRKLLIQSRKDLRSKHNNVRSGSDDQRGSSMVGRTQSEASRTRSGGWQSLSYVGLAFMLAILFGCSGCNQGVSSQDVMAKVNGSKILRTEVDK